MKKLLLVLVVFVQAACAKTVVANVATANAKQVMQAHVESLPVDCLYDDGYVCAEPSDPLFYQQTLNGQLIQASYLQAWHNAYKAFLALPEITEKQKALHHYKIGFADEAEHYIVLFSPLRMPYIHNGKPQAASNVTYGKAVKIWVAKSDLVVTKHLYLK